MQITTEEYFLTVQYMKCFSMYILLGKISGRVFSIISKYTSCEIAPLNSQNDD
jgi:hypothetical protein